MSQLLTAALTYAEQGWPVFPCKVAGKAPLFPQAHPEGSPERRTCRGQCGAIGHGFYDATTAPDVLRNWWTRYPLANVAVATGSPGPDVLDVDTKKGLPGMELFNRVRPAGLLRGATAIVRTPSGGLHVWFAGTDQPPGAIGAGRALELKARGGYVLVPPSYVDAGDYAGTYELIEYRETAGTIDFAAVRRLLEPSRPAVSLPRPGRSSNADALVRWVEALPEGNRNHGLFWAACRALETGATPSVLVDLAAAAERAGIPAAEAARTVESARTRIRSAS
jgi:hypothetical protein